MQLAAFTETKYRPVRPPRLTRIHVDYERAFCSNLAALGSEQPVHRREAGQYALRFIQMQATVKRGILEHFAYGRRQAPQLCTIYLFSVRSRSTNQRFQPISPSDSWIRSERHGCRSGAFIGYVNAWPARFKSLNWAILMRAHRPCVRQDASQLFIDQRAILTRLIRSSARPRPGGNCRERSTCGVSSRPKGAIGSSTPSPPAAMIQLDRSLF